MDLEQSVLNFRTRDQILILNYVNYRYENFFKKRVIIRVREYFDHS